MSETEGKKSLDEPKKELISSKDNLKPYFLPVYAIWALIIPTGLILLNAYKNQTGDEPLNNFINWQTVPAMYALFGLVYPLMLVTFSGFYTSFMVNMGFETFSELWTGLSDPDLAEKAQKSLFLVIFVTLLWVGPLGHLVIAFFFHKKYIDTKNNTNQKWSDYFFGFI